MMLNNAMKLDNIALMLVTLALSSAVSSANTIQCHECIYWEGVDPSKGSQPNCASSWPGDNLVTCTSANSNSKSDAEIEKTDDSENPKDIDADVAESDEFYCFTLKTILDSKEVVHRGCAQYSGVEKLQGYCEYSTNSFQTSLGPILRGAALCYCSDDDGCTFFDEKEFGDGTGGDEPFVHSDLGF